MIADADFFFFLKEVGVAKGLEKNIEEEENISQEKCRGLSLKNQPSCSYPSSSHGRPHIPDAAWRPELNVAGAVPR